MIKLEILRIARADLKNIAYKHSLLSGVNSARKITDKIRKNLELLKRNPYLGRICDEPPLADEGYRRLICGNYLCLYKVKNNCVMVYRIVDGRTDYPKLFDTK